MAQQSCYRKRQHRIPIKGWFTPQRELFCRLVALGCGPTAAARLSGMPTDNASRLLRHFGIWEHVTRLRKDCDVPWMRKARATLLPALEAVRSAAMAGHRFQDAIHATMLMTVIGGVMSLSLSDGKRTNVSETEWETPVRHGRLPRYEALTTQQAKAAGFLALIPKRIVKTTKEKRAKIRRRKAREKRKAELATAA